MESNWLLEIFEGNGWQGEPKIKFYYYKKMKCSGFSLEYEYHEFLMTSEFQRKLIETTGDLDIEDPETGDMIYLRNVFYNGYELDEEEGTVIFSFVGKQIEL